MPARDGSSAGGWMTRFTSNHEMSNTNPARAIRPIQRRRSPAGSRAIPTGPRYCSRPGVMGSSVSLPRTGDSNGYRLPSGSPGFPALLLGAASPDTCVLTRVQRPVEAGRLRDARATDSLSCLDLRKSWACCPDGEEDLRISVAARRLTSPVHFQCPHPSLRRKNPINCERFLQCRSGSDYKTVLTGKARPHKEKGFADSNCVHVFTRMRR